MAAQSVSCLNYTLTTRFTSHLRRIYHPIFAVFPSSFSRSFSHLRSSDTPLTLRHFIPQAASLSASPDILSDALPASEVLPRGRIYHETYGCQMNVNDMEIVLAIMKNSGYSDIVEAPESAEIIFINTCAIRDNAEQRVWQRLNYFWFLKRQWKSNVAQGRSQSLRPPKVVVLGCMAERLKDKILDSDKMVDVVCGPDAYRDLPRLLEEVEYGQKGINTLLSLEETYADINPLASCREPRGFGFVQFVDPADAADAKYQMDRQRFQGRELTVVFAEENRKKPVEMRARERTRSRSYDRRRSSARYSRSRSPARRYDRSQSRSRDRYSRSPKRSRYSRSLSPRDRKTSRERSDSPESRERSYSHSPSPHNSRSRTPSADRSRSRSLSRDPEDLPERAYGDSSPSK